MVIEWSGHSLVAVGRITYKRAPEPRLYSTNCETACAKIPDMMACSVEKPSCEKLRAQAASNVPKPAIPWMGRADASSAPTTPRKIRKIPRKPGVPEST